MSSIARDSKEHPTGPPFLRKSTREFVENRRWERRYETFTAERAIQYKNRDTDMSTVISVSNKLKSGVTVEELHQLKNALLGHHPSTIEAALGCEGALRGLAREISGHDVQKQLEAVGCCCNLALGDERAGLAAARAAGAYIIAHTTSMSEQLAVASLWALGNLAGSGIRPCFVLIRQGALHHVCELLATTSDNDILEAAIYAALHIVYQLKDQLGAKYHEKLLSVLVACGRDSAWRPLAALSCHQHYVAAAKKHDIVGPMCQNIQTFTQTDDMESKFNQRLALRCLANLCVDKEMCDSVLDKCIENNYKICYTLHEIGQAGNEIYWLLGNMMNYALENVKRPSFQSIICYGKLLPHLS